MFDIQFASQPIKFLRKCDSTLRERITRKIETLKIDPVPHDSKRIIGSEEKTFRVRVGKYRILYVVYYDQNAILM